MGKKKFKKFNKSQDLKKYHEKLKIIYIKFLIYWNNKKSGNFAHETSSSETVISSSRPSPPEK